MGLRPFLFGVGGRQVFGPSPVHHVYLLRAQQFALHRGVHRGHAPANDHHPATDRQGGELRGLAQCGDEVHRVLHPAQVFAGHTKQVGLLQAHAQK